MKDLYKLTVADVLEVRRRLQSGEQSHQQIANAYGTSKSAISDISKGKNWSWLPNIDVEDLDLIQALADDGMSHADIADKFDTPVKSMTMLIRRIEKETLSGERVRS